MILHYLVLMAIINVEPWLIYMHIAADTVYYSVCKDVIYHEVAGHIKMDELVGYHDTTEW